MIDPLLVPCPGCGGLFPDGTGPVHRYLESSPGCWAAYGEVLAREYGSPGHFAVHRLTVDAYAAQHPGQPSPQTAQSVAVHLLSLYAVLDRGLSPEAATRLIGRAVERGPYPWLVPPASRGDVTVADVVLATSVESHARAVRAWARSAWEAWQEYHGQVVAWTETASPEAFGVRRS
ncbi:DUF5946 family protein [Rubrivirga sp.]|uniref:DUF5946 family protein n=1 Tax=Rubrivirga sp. TaxID=1885344 RepID=UPI003C792A9C